MNLEVIRERLRSGFRPFALELTNGKRYEVPHPEFIMVGRNIVAVFDKPDVIATIDALHIAALEDLPPRTRKSR